MNKQANAEPEVQPVSDQIDVGALIRDYPLAMTAAALLVGVATTGGGVGRLMSLGKAVGSSEQMQRVSSVVVPAAKKATIAYVKAQALGMAQSAFRDAE